MKEFHLKVSTPSGTVYDGSALRISVRGIGGELAVMAGHIPFVTMVKEGEIRIIGADEKTLRATSAGGLLTVSRELVSLLASDFSFV